MNGCQENRPSSPRLDLSVASFAISDGGKATVPLTGLELNLYAVSIPWLRIGFSASAGRGHATIDGTGVGQTPLANLAIPIGEHQITFRHPQFGERQQTVVITMQGPNRIAVDLTKK